MAVNLTDVDHIRLSIHQGMTVDMQFEWSNVVEQPYDLTHKTGYFRMSEYYGAPTYLLNLNTSDITGYLSKASVPTNGILYLHLPDTVTAVLPAGRAVYEVFLLDDITSAKKKLAGGFLYVMAQV